MSIWHNWPESASQCAGWQNCPSLRCIHWCEGNSGGAAEWRGIYRRSRQGRPACFIFICLCFLTSWYPFCYVDLSIPMGCVASKEKLMFHRHQMKTRYCKMQHSREVKSPSDPQTTHESGLRHPPLHSIADKRVRQFVEQPLGTAQPSILQASRRHISTNV